MDINDQVTKLAKVLFPTLPQAVQVDLNLADKSTTILADHNQIDQVIMNLAINASEAMPNGGHLRIRTDTISLDEAYCNVHQGVNPVSM